MKAKCMGRHLSRTSLPRAHTRQPEGIRGLQDNHGHAAIGAKHTVLSQEPPRATLDALKAPEANRVGHFRDFRGLVQSDQNELEGETTTVRLALMV